MQKNGNHSLKTLVYVLVGSTQSATLQFILHIYGHLCCGKYQVGLYMIGCGKGKIILKFPPFFRLNELNQERENSKHQMKTKTVLFSFDFEFPALDFPRSI